MTAGTPSQDPGPSLGGPPRASTAPPQPPKRSKTKRNVAIGCGGLLALLFVCGALGAILGLGGNKATTAATSTAAGTSAAVAQRVPSPTVPAVATNTPTVRAMPIATARPAPATSVPTALPIPTAAPPAALPKVGETAKTRDYTLTLNAVEDPSPDTTGLGQQPGMRRVALDVTITNTSTKPVAYNPLYAKIKLADNTESNTSFMSKDPSLKSGDLAPGESARGWLTFEVPEAAQLSTFSYEVIAIGSGGRVVFNLKP